MQRNTPTKFREGALSSCEVMRKVGENLIEIYGAFFYPISLTFCAKCDLFMLRNTPMKFREGSLSGCEVMWKVGENLIIKIYGAYFNPFL